MYMYQSEKKDVNKNFCETYIVKKKESVFIVDTKFRKL